MYKAKYNTNRIEYIYNNKYLLHMDSIVKYDKYFEKGLIMYAYNRHRSGLKACTCTCLHGTHLASLLALGARGPVFCPT